MRKFALVFIAAISVHAQDAAPAVVRIVRHGGRHQLMRNGQPYFVKGAVGAVHLEELAAAGGNSIRAGVDALDRAQSLGLTVLAGLPFGKQRTGFDYSDAKAVNRQRERIREIVTRYRTHPALLVWALGNELEIYTTPEQRIPLWKEVNYVARMVHELDPNHPVITPVGGQYRDMLHELVELCPDLDAIGLNSYSDMLTLPEDIAKQGWKRAYLITEFGPRGHWQVPKTPWKLPIEDSSTEKAEFYRKAYLHAVESRPACLGSYVFHWAQHHEKTHTWYGMFLEDGSRTESVDVMTFLWGGRWPANRSPRIGPMKIEISSDESDSRQPSTFAPAALIHCRVDASDPDGDPLEVGWDLRLDVTGNRNVGGDREEPTPPIEGVVVSAAKNSATFRLPEEEGYYRLFVYVRDGHANAATANVPLAVRKPGYARIPEAGDQSRVGAGIQRTMTLLATSTPRRRNSVRILFYGQSLSKQSWTRDVAENLRKRFPYADLTIANKAIGGYSAEYLIRTLPHDVYGFYPDLIVFHDFGGRENYERIIAGIRSHTTAEILIQNDRPAGELENPATADKQAARDRDNMQWLEGIAKRYHCELADIRTPWLRYLKDSGRKPTDVLPDGVHFSGESNHLMAELTGRHLRYDPELPREAWKDLVKSYEIGRDLLWSNGRLALEFEGNRLDAIAGPGGAYHAAEAEVLIDGRKPSEIPDLYFITRPTDTYAVDWPAVNRIGSEKPLLIEDWTLRFLETNADDSRLRFEVSGSRTGPDGTGVTTERFVSQSGRVVIEPGDWGIARAFQLRRVLTPAGFEVKWAVVPMFADVYRAPRIEDPSREVSTVLALGLPNGRHRLELIARGKTVPPLQSIRVYRPPVR